MPSLDSTARRHKALGEPVRLRIVRLLMERSLCVCELQEALRMPQYAVSRQLGVLREAGWVEGWRSGTWMHYRLRKDLPKSWKAALAAFHAEWAADKEVRRALRWMKAQCADCS